ncbi:MAG: hypothetical protein HKN57_03830 [Xanthomonadales bacterium]|nr:hypothetical protein [Gammaproteobacteria bacterium]MBT8054978.1 hypothetical protein [Gammaproteobacteria bacterium]NND56360.1 hypothetical protein [Xanthomonadales bacterium]NNK50417.1 hypothetical protein [Xanthomonadales bacterium]
MSPRISLVIIAAVFLLPLLLAWFMYSGTISFKPAATRNLGRLVEPPIPLAWEQTQLVASSGEPAIAGEVFAEHWVVLYRITGECDSLCRQEITSLRQIHLAAGRNQSRILIALLLPGAGNPDTQGALREIYPRFHLLTDPSENAAKALYQAADGPTGAYLIDPLGNIMMTYAAGADPNQLKQDLKRLLTWSKLDEQS